MLTATPTRVCKDCKATLPEDAFYRNGHGHFESYCKPCKRERSRQHYAESDREQLRQTQRDAHLSVKYRLTREQYDEMLASQGGVCAVCRQPESAVRSKDNPTVRDLCVDHDHSCCPGPKSCGRCVRGLLCRKCNSMFGHADDDLDRLWAAIEYLISHEAAPSIREGATDHG